VQVGVRGFYCGLSLWGWRVLVGLVGWRGCAIFIVNRIVF